MHELVIGAVLLVAAGLIGRYYAMRDLRERDEEERLGPAAPPEVIKERQERAKVDVAEMLRPKGFPPKDPIP
jgi:hypothetical protein